MGENALLASNPTVAKSFPFGIVGDKRGLLFQSRIQVSYRSVKRRLGKIREMGDSVGGRQLLSSARNPNCSGDGSAPLSARKDNLPKTIGKRTPVVRAGSRNSLGELRGPAKSALRLLGEALKRARIVNGQVGKNLAIQFHTAFL